MPVQLYLDFPMWTTPKIDGEVKKRALRDLRLPFYLNWAGLNIFRKCLKEHHVMVVKEKAEGWTSSCAGLRDFNCWMLRQANLSFYIVSLFILIIYICAS